MLLEYQGPRTFRTDRTEWTQAKSRAIRILNFAQAVLETYESKVCPNLIINGHENIGVGVELKLRALLSFEDIYARVIHGESKAAFQSRHHDFVKSFSSFLSLRRDKINPSSKEVIAKTHQDVSPRLA